jgi:copper transport protein
MIACAAAAAAAAVVAPAAQAHAKLIASKPGDRAVLAQAPKRVVLRFDDTVRALPGTKAIRNGGRSVLAGKPHIERSRRLVIPLRKLGDGDYSVRWRVLSDDGHTLEGVLAFAVGAGRAPPKAALSVGGGVSVRDVVARWFFLFGLLTAAGAAAFAFFVWTEREGEPTRLYGLMFGGFFATFLGASGLIPHDGAATRAGAVYEAAGVVALVGAVVAAISIFDRRFRLLPQLAALALLPLPTLAGHALDRAQLRPLNAAVDVLHLGAAAVWVGGLVALALAAQAGQLAPFARRFSTLAVVSVLVLAATGVGRALGELSAVSQLWSTGYGRAIVIKTGLLAGLVALGWFNRYRLLPHLARSADGGTLGRLRASAGTEVALAAGVVVAVAFLTDLPPGKRAAPAAAAATKPAPRRAPPAPPHGYVVLARRSGNLAVTVAVQAVRRPRVEAILVGPDDFGAENRRVSIAGRSADAACGAGCYAGPTLARAPRSLAVAVDGKHVAFPLPRPWPPPNATALVRRLTRQYSSEPAVAFVETLSNGFSRAQVSRWRLESPNRYSYRIRGGAAAIVIGDRQWFRPSAGRPWQQSPQQPLPQPRPPWLSRVTDAYVLRRSRVTAVSFYGPEVKAWFTVRLRMPTARPLALRMTAAAHFMTHRYTAFGGRRRIHPPR